MTRSRLLPMLLIIALFSAACAPRASATTTPTTLTVFAAASLTDSFKELAALFESKNPGVTVALSFGGSQALAQQIDQGAPADVFASASAKYMDAALKSGRVNQGDPLVFAKNRLVVIFPAANHAGILSLADLAKPGLKIDLADKSVPAGQYTLDFLDKAAADPTFGPAFKTAVLANVVSNETDVRAVLSKVALGEADAGVVYISDYQSAAGKLGKLDIPDSFNSIASYPIAPLADSKNAGLARAFVTLVLSPEGQAILAKHGFLPAAP